MQLTIIPIFRWYKMSKNYNWSSRLHTENDINSLHCWSEQWSLLFNPTKIIQISFKSNLQTSYTIGTSSITKVESHKNLGIILSSNLTWDAHYDQIIAKAYSILGLLRRTSSLQTLTKSKKQLAISLVWSQLLYCSYFMETAFHQTHPTTWTSTMVSHQIATS